jgi:hypothetical protein
MATRPDRQTYLLDSSVATLILDGELWGREPYTLLGHRKELRLQLEQTRVSLQELENKSATLRRSLAAFRFVQQRQAAGSPPLLITPTVGLELSRRMHACMRCMHACMHACAYSLSLLNSVLINKKKILT